MTGIYLLWAIVTQAQMIHKKVYGLWTRNVWGGTDDFSAHPLRRSSGRRITWKSETEKRQAVD